MGLTQDERLGELTTPLGKDVLVLQKFDGFEGLGELFEFHVDALSEKENIDFDKVIGQSCTIKLKTYDKKTRIFNGILTEARWIEKFGDHYHYRLVLRPWFALLDHKADCRVFLDKNVKDIIKEVFTKAGFNDFEFKTTEDYDPIPYCVQYNESDYAFCSRLMEQFGIYYFFKHSDGKHTMVLADSRSSHEPNPDVAKLPYSPLGSKALDMQQRLGAWTSERRFSTGKYKLNDYDFEKPPKDLKSNKEAAENYTHSKLEYYEWKGKYSEKDKGETFAKIRLEAEQALDHRRRADGDSPSVFAGSLITLDQHPNSGENREYLVARANHRFGTQDYRSGSGKGSENYSGSYEFQPSDRPYRSQERTQKPRIFGIHTGLVVAKKGESGEEISTDEYGRIWVQFPWDSDQGSYPVRVAQVWAGNGWGGQFIPRIGMEVVVEYEFGDPDHPLVVGCVYNGQNPYPYDLPANKTQSGLKSNSSKGHGGYNEFMFEDKKGGEFIRMHAQRDHLVTVNRNQTGSVGAVGPEAPTGADQTWTVGGNRSWTMQMGNDTTDIQMGNQTITIDMGSQTVQALQGINLSVCYGLSTIVITPAAISITSPTINLTAEATINITAPTINITGIVNLTGMLNITGGMTVDGMVPMLVPA